MKSAEVMKKQKSAYVTFGIHQAKLGNFGLEEASEFIQDLQNERSSMNTYQ